MRLTEDQFTKLCEFIVEFQGQFGPISASMTKADYEDETSAYITTFHMPTDSGFESKFNLITGALDVPDVSSIGLLDLEFKLPGQSKFISFSLLPIYFHLSIPMDDFLADDKKMALFSGQLMSMLFGYYNGIQEAMDMASQLVKPKSDIKN